MSTVSKIILIKLMIILIAILSLILLTSIDNLIMYITDFDRVAKVFGIGYLDSRLLARSNVSFILWQVINVIMSLISLFMLYIYYKTNKKSIIFICILICVFLLIMNML